jgi:hypothetical protein
MPLVSAYWVSIGGVAIDVARIISGGAGEVASDLAIRAIFAYFENNPQNLATYVPHILPGQKYFAVRGGLYEALRIVEITEDEFDNIKTVVKDPIP